MEKEFNTLLTIEAVKSDTTEIRWSFGNVNAYYLLGVIEDVKHKLLQHIDEVNEDE